MTKNKKMRLAMIANKFGASFVMRHFGMTQTWVSDNHDDPSGNGRHILRLGGIKLYLIGDLWCVGCQADAYSAMATAMGGWNRKTNALGGVL